MRCFRSTVACASPSSVCPSVTPTSPSPYVAGRWLEFSRGEGDGRPVNRVQWAAGGRPEDSRARWSCERSYGTAHGSSGDHQSTAGVSRAAVVVRNPSSMNGPGSTPSWSPQTQRAHVGTYRATYRRSSLAQPPWRVSLSDSRDANREVWNHQRMIPHCPGNDTCVSERCSAIQPRLHAAAACLSLNHERPKA